MTTGLAQANLEHEPSRLAALLLAVAPCQLGGVTVRAPAGSARDAWLRNYQALAQQDELIRIPLSVTDEALEGGLDLAATLAAGRPKSRAGLLKAASGRTILLSMAERWTREAAARISSSMDRTSRSSAFTVIALDEGFGEDERVPDSLAERLAFHVIDLPDEPTDWPTQSTRAQILSARERLQSVAVSGSIMEALVSAGMRLGINSCRATVLAVHAARAHASLEGRVEANESDAIAAAALVFAPRATRLPDMTPDQAPEPEAPSDDEGDELHDDEIDLADGISMAERIIEACAANLPKSLLNSLKSESLPRGATELGRKHTASVASQRGRRIGIEKGPPRRGERINLPASLLAAAPWQNVRHGTIERINAARSRRFKFRIDDLRVHRHKSSTKSTTVFSVDASGSAAMHRLAEAKGAVEQLLAESYVRRDKVALIAFKARGAELILPPTRSLARARKALAELPGGGATPLACGIREAHEVARSVRRSGQRSVVVLLTDGRANVDADGRGGRKGATEHSLDAARRLRADGIASIVIDISPNPGQESRTLADTLGALYVPLPYGSASAISQAVRQFSRMGDDKMHRR